MTLSERRQRFFTNLYWTLSDRWVQQPYVGWRRTIQRWCSGMEAAHPFFPWRLLSWLDHNQQYCWAEMVMWKLYGDGRERWWHGTDQCRADCAKEGRCYCGKFMTPEYRSQIEANRPDDLPF